MPKVLTDPRYCKKCEVLFFRMNGNTDAKYCSRRCACRDRNTQEHQTKAGKAGGKVTGNKKRGTGTKGYIKINQRHEHRVVVERILGRKLLSKEIIHHINEDKHDNRPENLAVITRSKHAKIHFSKKYKGKIQSIRPSS